MMPTQVDTLPSSHTDVISSMAPVAATASKERFYRYFQEEATALQDQINHLGQLGLSGGERQDAIDHCLAGISHLSNEVTDASDYIPAYDQRTYAQAVKALSDHLAEVRQRITPKQRFTFKKSQKNGSAISLSDAAELAAAARISASAPNSNVPSAESSMVTTPPNLKTPESERADTVTDLPSFGSTFGKDYNEELSMPPASGRAAIRKPSFSQAKMIIISEHENLHIILPSSAARATSSGSLTELSRCVVDMSVPTTSGAPFANLMLKSISGSLIIAGQVAGAVHITGIENSVLVVSARQVRIHDCRNVSIYLHCVSRPIVENCSDIRMAPLPACYSSPPDSQVKQNLWDQVDDFKWLKAEPSPHWSILPEDRRLGEDLWTQVVPGDPSTSTEDILRAVGITKK